MDRTLEFDDAGRERAATLGLDLALVFLAHIDALDNHQASFRYDFDHLATPTFIF
jgi:hypothetical protein